MNSEEVGNGIAKYFFQNYLPDEIMYELVDRLIPQYELVMEAVLILQERLEG